MVSSGELMFFDLIKDSCDTIFDIGCREDVDYILKSTNKSFHLFEPNPIFYNACKNKIDGMIGNNIYLNNFGIGNKSETLEYYEDSQSFVKRYVQFTSMSVPIILSIKRFSEYISENNIDKIDFIKIDTEGCEPDILLDNIEYIKNNVKFIQFEYASTWLDRKDKMDLSYVLNTYGREFNFYFIYNEEHPVSANNPYILTQISNQKVFDYVKTFMYGGYGFEIALIKRDYDNF